MKKNNSHIALGAHYKHLKWTFIPNGSSIFILMQQEKRNSYLIDVPCIQSFHIGILQIDIFLYIHKWSSSLNNGKYTGYKFIPYDIDCCHLRLTLCLPANIVVMQLSIKMDSRHRRQMKKPLHLLVGDGTYLCPGMDTCSGLIFKGSDTGIAGKFSPIFKPCEITGIHYQERGTMNPIPLTVVISSKVVFSSLFAIMIDLISLASSCTSFLRVEIMFS